MKRKFTDKMKEAIFERDGGRCVLGCSSRLLSPPHHCWFGSSTPKGWKKSDKINGEWNGVILCYQSHQAIHHGGVFCNGKSLKENMEYTRKLAQKRYDKNST